MVILSQNGETLLQTDLIAIQKIGGEDVLVGYYKDHEVFLAKGTKEELKERIMQIYLDQE